MLEQLKIFILILLVIATVSMGCGPLSAAEIKEAALVPLAPEPIENKPIVLRVVEGSPGAIAGLRVGDLIVSVDGEEISTKDQFVKVLRKKKVEKKSISLGVLRGGAQQTFVAEFIDPSERLGIDIGDYFLITGKKPHPLALLQKKGDFGVGINGKVLAGEAVKFNIRVDNLSKASIKVGPDYIMVTTNGTSLKRLSPEEVVDILYPEPAELKDPLSSERRRLGKRERDLLRKRHKELKVLSELELREADILPGRFIIGSLFYKNPSQRYPVNLKIEVGDQTFNFPFEKEAE